jgi:hypothetical protein
MATTMNMVYWKGENFWVGKLLDHPEIMSQGETIEELEANLREAYLLMNWESVKFRLRYRIGEILCCPNQR